MDFPENLDSSFIGDLNKLHFGARAELKELAEKLEANDQVMIIIKRSDESCCFATFGGDVTAKDVTYMLAHTQARLFQPQ